MNITAKGAATRDRIVATAADLVLERSAAGTSLDDIRAGTSTSKSQLFHYFPGGKRDLVSAIADFQFSRVLDAQQPWLDRLATAEDWSCWRDAVLAHYGAQRHFGCPIGALSSETARTDAKLAAEVRGHMDTWRAKLEAGVRRMPLADGIDPAALATAIFASLQGGLLLTQSEQSLEPLRAALDGALVLLGASQRSL
jgi:AcrR family transcriptional regulator